MHNGENRITAQAERLEGKKRSRMPGVSPKQSEK